VFAETDKIIAGTPGKKFGKGQSVQVEVAPSTIIVKSAMVNNEKWDLVGRNKKNVQAFLEAFHIVSTEASNDQFIQWEDQVSQLQRQTMFELEEYNKERELVDKTMNFSHGSMVVTYVILGLNLLVFIWMVASGVGFFEPTVEDMVKWGGNYRPLTAGGEWWRIITAVFVHVGIIHLALNTYALFMAGMFLEPIIGRTRFIAAYLATGILASLVSLWWYNGEIISAGASGAVFGLYGVFLALLTTSIIPLSIRTTLLSSIGVFIFYNIINGAGQEGVDNAAHIGGLTSGLLIGYCYFPGIKSHPWRKPLLTASLILLFSILTSFVYLFNIKDDSVAYDKKIDEIMKLQEEATTVMEYGNGDDLLYLVSTVSQPKWEKAKEIIDETKTFILSPPLVNHRRLMAEYIDLRIEHVNLVIIALQGREVVNDEIEVIVKRINEVTDQIAIPSD
jgi:rhomboid protease GluP